MVQPSHPGTITFVDGNSGQVVVVRPVNEVPESLRFAEAGEGLIPVVRVVATVHGGQRTIEEMGPQGQVLRRTVQRSTEGPTAP